MKKKTAYSVGWCFLLLLTLSMSFGCAPKNRGLSDATANEGMDNFASNEARQQDRDSQVDKRVRDYLAAEENDPRGQEVLIQTAKTAIGIPYVYGGTTTAGFDCSGFVQWTFNQVGVKLPRTADDQARVGRAIRKVEDMQAGDIVAFHHPKRGYHTGIYVGEGKFIHSPRKRTTVRINNLSDPYFNTTFVGARRIDVSTPEDIAAAEKMLAEYREQEARRIKSSMQAAKRGKGKTATVASRDNKRKSAAAQSSKASTAKSAKATKSVTPQAKKAVSKNNKTAKPKQTSAAPPSDKKKTTSARAPTKGSKKANASSSSSTKPAKKD